VIEVQVSIAPHESADYRAAVELRRRILRRPLGLDLSEEQLAAECDEAHIVAKRGDTVVGCLVMVPKPEGIVKMRQVAVEPDLQGQGIGEQMVRFSEEWSRNSRFDLIELNARETAVRFYLKLDYELDGEPFIEVSIPHRRMIKAL